MINFEEMDKIVSIEHQLSDQSSEPVVLINVFTVDPEDVDQLFEAWKSDSSYFMKQPGFISTQLHKGIQGSTTFLNYAIWETVGQFRAAFTNPEFHAKLASYPDSATASPHLFRKVAVPGMCLG